MTNETPRMHADAESRERWARECREGRVRWHSDPGHAWLQVDAALVRDAGFIPSGYSYHGQTFAYLEEDCDAPAWLLFIGDHSAGRDLPENVTPRGDSPVRRLPQYPQTEAASWRALLAVPREAPEVGP